MHTNISKMSALKITTTEMHTAGEPLRILESGVPKIHGDTILDKRRYVRENLDYIRKLVIHEPRGHSDMYGAILVDPDNPDADIACLFIDNDGYSTMCGHAVIALSRYAVDKGLVKSRTSPDTRVRVQCPCGLVDVLVEYRDGRAGGARFESVPAFVVDTDIIADVPRYGKVTIDISYGGNFFAFVPADRLGLCVNTSSVSELQEAGAAVSEVLRRDVKLTSPDGGAPATLYGTILTDGKDDTTDQQTNNFCVFANKQVDRSPCGSGVTARVALMHARGKLPLNHERTFVGPAGGKFRARAIRQVKCGSRDAVVVEVMGKGSYFGNCTFELDEDDEIGRGFLLR